MRGGKPDMLWFLECLYDLLSLGWRVSPVITAGKLLWLRTSSSSSSSLSGPFTPGRHGRLAITSYAKQAELAHTSMWCSSCQIMRDNVQLASHNCRINHDRVNRFIMYQDSYFTTLSHLLYNYLYSLMVSWFWSYTLCCRNEAGSEKCDGTGETSRKGDWLLCFLIFLEGLLTEQVIRFDTFTLQVSPTDVSYKCLFYWLFLPY